MQNRTMPTRVFDSTDTLVDDSILSCPLLQGKPKVTNS